MWRPVKKQQLTVDPSPNAPSHHELTVLVTIPTYGKPSDDMKTAQAVKAMLQTGVHSRAKVELIDDKGFVEVADREYRKVV